MQGSTNDRTEDFLAEDLLISLGAIRMALSWMDGGSGTPGQAVALARLEQELADLHGRSRAFYRTFRRGSRDASQDPAPAPIPTTTDPLDPIDLDSYGTDAVAEVLSLDRSAPRRAREGRGLPPPWLTDLDEVGGDPAGIDLPPPTPEIVQNPDPAPEPPQDADPVQDLVLDPEPAPEPAPGENDNRTAVHDAQLPDPPPEQQPDDDLGDSIDQLLASAMVADEGETAEEKNGDETGDETGEEKAAGAV